MQALLSENQVFACASIFINYQRNEIEMFLRFTSVNGLTHVAFKELKNEAASTFSKEKVTLFEGTRAL